MKPFTLYHMNSIKKYKDVEENKNRCLQQNALLKTLAVIIGSWFEKKSKKMTFLIMLT